MPFQFNFSKEKAFGGHLVQIPGARFKVLWSCFTSSFWYLCYLWHGCPGKEL